MVKGSIADMLGWGAAEIVAFSVFMGLVAGLVSAFVGEEDAS